MRKKFISIIVVIALLTAYLTCIDYTQVNASTRIPENIYMTVDGGEAVTVRALNIAYENNVYISLRDTAYALANTSKSFNVEITSSSIDITTSAGYSDELAHDGFTEDELEMYAGGDPGNTALTVNGDARKYFSLIIKMEDGIYDCYISPMDIAMILDINIDMNMGNGIIVDTTNPLLINPAVLESYGFFQSINGCVVGDATTGEIFYGYNLDNVYPIASTTKLMTYLLTMEAIRDGVISMDTNATVSKEAALLSASSDGVISMAEGWQIPVSELILGALLPSSNESALTLAQLISGDEATFVEKMNNKAKELNMSTALFYNSNGLPSYTGTMIPAKRQNHMSPEDMFRLSSAILNEFPEVKDVTSQKTARLSSLGLDIKNTNGLLYNMSCVNGLKTGTTDKAGACLVASLTVNDGATDHDLVVVVLGAENSQMRVRVAEVLARYAREVILKQADKISYTAIESTENDGTINSEQIVEKVIEYALNKKASEY